MWIRSVAVSFPVYDDPKYKGSWAIGGKGADFDQTNQCLLTAIGRAQVPCREWAKPFDH